MKPTLLRQQVEAVIKEIQPALGLHGGSIELVNITPENVVELRFEGACVGCVAADMTLNYGLKEMIMLRVEDVEDVISINNEPITHDVPDIQLTR
jgi:Fe-S cluster biogenesis protein NfuA